MNASAETRGLLIDPRKRDAQSTTLDRAFPGGEVTMLGANSMSDFRGTTVDGVLQDEVDDYEDDPNEGDATALADRATETFTDPLKLKCSTPTLAGFSKIHAGYLSGDQQKYFLPCPCCGAFQWLKTERLKFSFTEQEHQERLTKHPNDCTWTVFDQGSKSAGALTYDLPNTIYVCEACNRGWTDHQRIAAYMSGHKDNPAIIVNGVELRAEWRATVPPTGKRSRQFSGMYATIGLKKTYANYLHMFADKFLTAVKGGRAKLQAWTNTFKCEPFEDEYEKVDWQELQKRAEDYGPELPNQVVIVVASIDIQKDRIEILSMGFGDEQEAWILDYTVMYGDFDMPEFQARVEETLLNKRFQHSVLGSIGYKVIAIDSGHQTKVKSVFRFCKKHRLNNWYAIKGFESISGAIYSVRKERAFQIPVFNLGTDYLKNTIAANLQNEPGPNAIHFPKGKQFDEKFFQSVCSEKKVITKLPNGGEVSKWHKITSTKRNEVWDMMVYCFGMFEVLRREGIIEHIARKWKEIQSKLKSEEPATAPKEYILKPPTEAKQPELKVEQPKKRNPFRRDRRFQRGRPGIWNPLGL